MRALAALAALSCLNLVLAWIKDAPTLELVVRRATADGQCTWVSLRPSGQTHKGLRTAPHVHQLRLLDARGQRVTQNADIEHHHFWFAADDERLALETTRGLCGDDARWMDRALLPLGFVGQRPISQVVLGEPAFKVPPLRVQPLQVSGPSANRVDLTFFADGYTEGEYEKFVNDVQRLAEDISGNHTFDTVRPLLNFWAAFTPSVESGIGVGGKPKDTAFGLYRDGTELRGVYYSKPDAARAACYSLGDQCDFPILVGNDGLYGGLGGEFTVITPSLANGALVLRHELGHSIIDIGEEYDGMSAPGYFGVNAARTPAALGWAHWLTHPHTNGETRLERAAMPFQRYAWTMLNASAPWAARFATSGTYARHLVRFSLSGVPHVEDLVVRLDGNVLGWAPRKDIGYDRWHYDIPVNAPLEEGEHELMFELKERRREGEAQLCSAEVLEFGDEKEFNTSTDFVGAFPTFADDLQTAAVRPTNEACLMRQVTTPEFCVVCKEGLWHALLSRVSLVDAASAQNCVLTLQPLPLGLGLRVRWTKDGEHVEEWAGKREVRARGRGVWAAEVIFESQEIRKDEEGWTKEVVEWVVDGGCD